MQRQDRTLFPSPYICRIQILVKLYATFHARFHAVRLLFATTCRMHASALAQFSRVWTIKLHTLHCIEDDVRLTMGKRACRIWTSEPGGSPLWSKCPLIKPPFHLCTQFKEAIRSDQLIDSQNLQWTRSRNKNQCWGLSSKPSLQPFLHSAWFAKSPCPSIRSV